MKNITATNPWRQAKTAIHATRWRGGTAAAIHRNTGNRTDVTRPIVVFDRPGPGRVLAPERVEGPRTEVKVTPFVATGFKAYVTPRAFFRSDIRFGIRSGIDDVLIRAGFGIDF